MKVEAHIHGRPCVGEELSGDVGRVHRVEAVTWVMLIDALGHGPKANHAAVLAVEALDALDAAASVGVAMQRIHKHLVGSRGGAGVLLRFDDEGVSFAGVGNVELRTLAGPQLPFVSNSGVIGGRMPRLRPSSLALREPGRALLFTDGVSRRAPLSSLTELGPEQLCERLIAEHSVVRDDATVVDVSYVP